MFLDLASGQVQIAIGSYSAFNAVSTKGARAIGVTGTYRSPKLPDVTTLVEQGVKGKLVTLEGGLPLFAPAGTPTDIVTKLSGQIKAALDMPETKARADTAGIELRYLAPAALEALVKSDTDFWGKTIQAAGIKAD
jgi:tripartite-type tricarboxylate transporter receptor subunit TctC